MQFIKLMLVLAITFPSISLAKTNPSIYVHNTTTNKTIVSQSVEVIRPIASITKLMTAMVTLDYDKDLSRRLMLSTRVPSNLPKQLYTRLELINAMLIRSDNAAAETLAEDYPGGRTEFINRMNWQVKEWDILNTHFEDASGLGVHNTSTAVDVAEIIVTASSYWLINDASIKKQALFDAQIKKKNKRIVLPHTNTQLLLEFDNIVTTKTGYTTPAGWCVALVVKNDGQEYVIVVLGSTNKLERRKTVEKVMYTHILH